MYALVKFLFTCVYQVNRNLNIVNQDGPNARCREWWGRIGSKPCGPAGRARLAAMLPASAVRASACKHLQGAGPATSLPSFLIVPVLPASGTPQSASRSGLFGVGCVVLAEASASCFFRKASAAVAARLLLPLGRIGSFDAMHCTNRRGRRGHHKRHRQEQANSKFTRIMHLQVLSGQRLYALQ